MRREPVATAAALVTTLVLWASAFVGIRAGLAGYSPGGAVSLAGVVLVNARGRG